MFRTAELRPRLSLRRHVACSSMVLVVLLLSNSFGSGIGKLLHMLHGRLLLQSFCKPDVSTMMTGLRKRVSVGIRLSLTRLSPSLFLMLVLIVILLRTG